MTIHTTILLTAVAILFAHVSSKKINHQPASETGNHEPSNEAGNPVTNKHETSGSREPDDVKMAEKSNKDGELKEEDKRKWSDKSVRVWGKRDDDGGKTQKKSWDKNSVRVWGKRDDLENLKRTWDRNSVRVWGKRDDDVVENLKKSWDKNSVRVWGKRDDRREMKEEKKQWGKNSVRVWGKRDEPQDNEKRSWGQNSVRVWGKRNEDKPLEEKGKFVNPNRSGKWDKISRSEELRLTDQNDPDKGHSLSPDSNHDPTSKSTFVVEVPLVSGVDDQPSEELTKKRSAIVKRAIEDRYRPSGSWHMNKRAHFYPQGGPKRSWRTNVIRVWGKRS